MVLWAYEARTCFRTGKVSTDEFIIRNMVYTNKSHGRDCKYSEIFPLKHSMCKARTSRGMEHEFTTQNLSAETFNVLEGTDVCTVTTLSFA